MNSKNFSVFKNHLIAFYFFRCPFDFVNIYDGFNAWSPRLRTLCGQLRDGDVELYSRGHELFIEFVSGRGRYDSRTYAGLPYWMPKDDYSNKRRGFRALFEFSNKIVPLSNFLSENAGHIAGTRCDQMIINSKPKSISETTEQSIPLGGAEPSSQSFASVFSPYYPLEAPLNATCTFFFRGRNERDYIDKIRLYVIDFGDGAGEAIVDDTLIIKECSTNVKDEDVLESNSTVLPAFTVTLESISLSPLSTRSVSLSKKSCLAKLSSGNESSKFSLRPGTMIGNLINRGLIFIDYFLFLILETVGPNLTLSFSSSSSPLENVSRKRRFLMQYSFVQDFHVETGGNGKQLVDEGCHFIFNSSSYKPVERTEGRPKSFLSFFTSPHFPRPYPAAMKCTYDFIIDRKIYSQLKIWFELFDVGEVATFGALEPLQLRCDERLDHVVVTQLMPSLTQREVNQNDTRSRSEHHSNLCGRYLPGPIVSDPQSLGFRIIFQTADRSAPPPHFATDYRGFRGNFEFIEMTKDQKIGATAKIVGNASHARDIACPSKQIIVGRKGAIVSPNYPKSFYPSGGLSCDWTIQSFSDQAKLQLMLTEFELEGAFNPALGVENCQNAAVEIYTGLNMNQPSHIRCSSASVIAGEVFVTTGSSARIRFVSSPASTGGPGFRIDWIEIYDFDGIFSIIYVLFLS